MLPFVAPLESWTSTPQADLSMHALRRVSLTKREETIAAALMTGQSNRAIARQLGLTEQSVKNRLTKIFQKHGVRSRTQLLLALTRSGR